jgi:type VI secretion system protein ImpE
MDPKEFLQKNDLDGALSTIQETIRANPSEAKHRIFLFQLLCIMGDWKRAVTQLKVSAELDPLALMMAQTYREGIICEVYREKVFAGEKVPLIFGEPEDWMAPLLEALKMHAQGNVTQAEELRTKAFELAPTMSGEINGTSFEWISDADMRLGPILEIVVDGKYYWMPFTSIKSMTIEPPVDLRDSVWMPASIKLNNGGDIVSLIPTRYSGSEKSADPKIKLSKVTDWLAIGEEAYSGLGQRILATDDGDVAIMDIRTLMMNQPEATDKGNNA